MSNDPQQKRQLAKRAQMARYVVSVDRQAKSSFDTREAAEQEARRISEGFPVVTVSVSDSENDSAKTLGPTHAPAEL
ncbi:MAG: hypothetical protein JWL62_1911 [Hyphomicrobiales bacterium]|nr:hypothetical protein [Hyphomicrobiales bacterium]